MLTHHVWPGGLALVAEGPDGAWAAAFGPWGWQAGVPRAILPDGPPEDAETERLEIPAWLAGSLSALEFVHGGLHTDFVHLDRLVARMRAHGRGGAVFVIGPSPLALILSGGESVVVVPADAGPARPADELSRASGWIVAFSGHVPLPTDAAGAPEPPRAEVHEPEPSRAAARAPEASHEEARAAVSPVAPRVSGERFVAAAQAIPEETAAAIRAVAGDGGLRVLPLIDGARTAAEIAAHAGLRDDQVAAVLKILVAAKLAFRYVARARPQTGVKTPGKR